MIWGALGLHPGEAQTVPRAELYAVLVAVERSDPAAALTVVSDSEVNVKLYAKGELATANAANHDLWTRLWNAKHRRSASLTIKWCKGHADGEHLAKGIISHIDMV